MSNLVYMLPTGELNAKEAFVKDKSYKKFGVFLYLFQWYKKVNSTNSPTSPTSYGKVLKANINKKISVAH